MNPRPTMVATVAGFGKSARRYERSFVAHCDIAAGACPPRTEIVKVVDSVLHGGKDMNLTPFRRSSS